MKLQLLSSFPNAICYEKIIKLVSWTSLKYFFHGAPSGKWTKKKTKNKKKAVGVNWSKLQREGEGRGGGGGGESKHLALLFSWPYPMSANFLQSLLYTLLVIALPLSITLWKPCDPPDNPRILPSQAIKNNWSLSSLNNRT